MIKYLLKCKDCAQEFESWFSTSDEYDRLLKNGVEFHSPPQNFGQVKATYGRDCDGNVFELQEIIDPNHPAKVFDV